MAALGVALGLLTVCLAGPSARPSAGGQDATVTGAPALSAEQVHSLIARAVENQHRNDRADEEFERVERVVTRNPGGSSETVSDRSDRLVPCGTGPIKLQVAENGTPVSQQLYRRELQFTVSALNIAIHPNERYKQDLARFEKRRRDRAELVDTSVKAFRMKWAGRETRPDPSGARASRTVAKFTLEPDPNFKPPNRLAGTFEHVLATLWVDESQAQFVRVEGDITSDISFGGGIAGKIYHGGHFAMEQSEVEPGVWLPTLFTYDVDGRKFLFGFGIHERTEISRYRRVGPPAQAIELIRAELNNLTAETPK
jgi:hypothetical protein